MSKNTDHQLEQASHERLHFLRPSAVARITGLTVKTLYRLEAVGDFPCRRRLGPNAVGWLSMDIDEWMRTRELVSKAR